MRAIVTRPRADSETLAAALARRGIDSVIAPVIRIETLRDPAAATAVAAAQAVLLTSANGARALAANTGRRGTPVIAVGDATAAAARVAGFGDVRSADGDARALAAFAGARLDPAAGPLLHVCGRRTTGDLDAVLRRAGFACGRLPLYDAVAAATLPEAAAAALRDGAADAVLLFSPRSAAVFVRLARHAGLADTLARVDACCLSAAVAEAAAPASWRRVVISPRPRADALCACLPVDGRARP